MGEARGEGQAVPFPQVLFGLAASVAHAAFGHVDELDALLNKVTQNRSLASLP